MMNSTKQLYNRDRAFFNSAKAISALSDHRCKLGCVVVDHHRILSSGHNSKTQCHGFQARLDQDFFNTPSNGPVHAEFAALLPFIRRHADLSTAILYVYRQDSYNNLAMARPCPRCMSIIKKCGIKKIKYTTPTGFATEKLVY